MYVAYMKGVNLNIHYHKSTLLNALKMACVLINCVRKWHNTPAHMLLPVASLERVQALPAPERPFRVKEQT